MSVSLTRKLLLVDKILCEDTLNEAIRSTLRLSGCNIRWSGEKRLEYYLFYTVEVMIRAIEVHEDFLRTLSRQRSL